MWLIVLKVIGAIIFIIAGGFVFDKQKPIQSFLVVVIALLSVFYLGHTIYNEQTAQEKIEDLMRSGDKHYKQKHYDAAIASYQQAIKIDSQYLYGYEALGKTNRALKRMDEAINNYQQSAILGSAYSHLQLGEIYAEAQRYEEAIINYKQASDAGINNAHFKLGNIYYKFGRYGDAIKIYRRALTQWDNKSEAKFHNGIGNSYLMFGNTNEAVKHYRKAENIDPEYRDIIQEFIKSKQSGGS